MGSSSISERVNRCDSLCLKFFSFGGFKFERSSSSNKGIFTMEESSQFYIELKQSNTIHKIQSQNKIKSNNNICQQIFFSVKMKFPDYLFVIYLIEMEQTNAFKRNAILQDLFNFTSKCISHCKTINKTNLTFEQIRCLENCGYNKAFLNMNMRYLIENADWTANAND